MLKIYIAMQNMKDEAKEVLGNKRGELGMGTLIAIAVAIIVAAYVMIPGLRTFGESVLSSMNDWWTNSVRTEIFPTS